MARSKIVGEVINAVALGLQLFCKILHIRYFSPTNISECLARDGEVRIEHLTGRSTHACFFSFRAV